MTITSLWLPVVITVFTWWFSTGLILLLVRLPQRTYWAALIGLGVLAGLSAWGLLVSAQGQTSQSVYCGFLCALMIWGWHEASFLMGKITGPRPLPCPEGVTGWRRFSYATATLIYHEVALFVTLVALAAATWQAPNPIGLWTFATLFALRLSSKFNIFLGVPNLTEEFFPDHLAHLKSYLPKRAMNPLMPVSILVAGGIGVWIFTLLSETQAGDPRATALAILATLIALGILEHLFMITPLPDAALWRWAAPAKLERDSDDGTRP